MKTTFPSSHFKTLSTALLLSMGILFLGCDNHDVLEEKKITHQGPHQEAPQTSAQDKSFFPDSKMQEKDHGLDTTQNAVSTFSVDVDTASYSLVRASLLNQKALPAKSSIRVEELLNYFNYDYAKPEQGELFGKNIEIASSPWHETKKLLRISLSTSEIETADRPDAHLVFLIDTSGSMSYHDKLPLLVKAFSSMIEHLKPTDKISIVTYAGTSTIVLNGALGLEADAIQRALTELSAGGGTAGAKGIQTAYQLATDNFIPGGINRVLLATDGDFNLGISSADELTKLITAKANSGVDLSVLGFGAGHSNDHMMELISNHGNGNYASIDTEAEARKVLVNQINSTILTVAKDVKIQVEFNPAKIKSYRLIGYDNRRLANTDFANDKVDAGDVGAGHKVTAFYEIEYRSDELSAEELASIQDQHNPAMEYRYSTQEGLSEEAKLEELAQMRLRFKAPDSTESKLESLQISLNSDSDYSEASKDFQLATTVIGFAEKLMGSENTHSYSYQSLINLLNDTQLESSQVNELQEMIHAARDLSKE